MFSGLTSSPGPQLDDNALRELVQNQIIREAGVDFESRPILVVYSCYLPNPKNANYDTLLSLLLQRLDQFVENDYVIVLFSAGTQYQPSWTWMFKAYASLGRKYRKNLKNLYIVHPSLWPKLIMQTMGAVVSPKFSRKVVWVYNLSKLGMVLPLKQLFIPDVVYQVDIKYSGGFSNSPTATIPSPTSESKSKVFGARLEDIMGENGEKGVPRVIRDCIRFILVNGIHVEGIFRRSPSSKLLQDAKAAYDRNDEHIDLEAFGGVHLACVLLKTFFRDLPEPVFPSSIYDVIRGITACQSEKEQLEYIKNAILPLLPYPTYMILRATLRLLHQVQLHASENLMTASNLTIVWSPNLVKSDNPLADFNICGMGAQGGGGGTMLKLCIERFVEVFEGEEPWEVVTGTQSEGTEDDGVASVVNTLQNSQVSISGDGGEKRSE